MSCDKIGSSYSEYRDKRDNSPNSRIRPDSPH
ncbi:hypothetical protein EHQ27_11590 [Leptospira wolffii]|nr:hypothetical protein EHQ32_15670 [Leptospira wolffii]TGK71058.1 hypothetical protein EHQ27_11590 [Leptospira wolffii]TGK75809.1 hypothetical protein EHQ35_05040 [Leptospira wolffii]TGL32796.1 hypothetical protein EHQ57_02000 [Leptospira wolffii]